MIPFRTWKAKEWCKESNGQSSERNRRFSEPINSPETKAFLHNNLGEIELNFFKLNNGNPIRRSVRRGGRAAAICRSTNFGHLLPTFVY